MATRVCTALAASVLALGMLLGASVGAMAQPQQITAIKGSKLFLYEGQGGKPVRKLPRDDVPKDLAIEAVSETGKWFQVTIDGTPYWVRKMQVRTEVVPEVAVDCQQVSKSYASSRGFGKCK